MSACRRLCCCNCGVVFGLHCAALDPITIDTNVDLRNALLSCHFLRLFPRRYRRKVEGEIDDICQEILGLLTDTLVPACGGDDEATVFYLKMKGDYLRYLAEVTEKEKRTQSADMACDAYNKAQARSTLLCRVARCLVDG